MQLENKCFDTSVTLVLSVSTFEYIIGLKRS